MREALSRAHLQRIVGWPVDGTKQRDFLALAETTQAAMREACVRLIHVSCQTVGEATQRLSSGGAGGGTQATPDKAS